MTTTRTSIGSTARGAELLDDRLLALHLDRVRETGREAERPRALVGDRRRQPGVDQHRPGAGVLDEERGDGDGGPAPARREQPEPAQRRERPLRALVEVG